MVVKRGTYKGIILCCYILTVFFTFLKPRNSYGQEKSIVQFEKDTILVEPSKTFLNRLSIDNSSDKELTIKIRESAANNLAILTLPPTLRVSAGQKVYIPVKYLANTNTIRENIQTFDFPISILDETDNLISDQILSFTTVLKNKRGLVLSTQSDNIYIDKNHTTATIELSAFNKSLTPLSVELKINSPQEGLNIAYDTEKITLQAGQQELIKIPISIKKGYGDLTDYTIDIKAYTTDEKLLSFKKVRVMFLGNFRNLIANKAEVYNPNHPNSINLSYINADNLDAIQITGSGEYAINPDMQWGYNLNFMSNTRNAYNINNSYITFDTHKYGLKLGSEYHNLDFNVNGKGITSYYNINSGKRLQLYVLDSDNTILSKDESTLRKKGHTFALEYLNSAEGEEISRWIALKNFDRYNRLTTYLISGRNKLFQTDNQELTLESAASLQSIKQESIKNNYNGIALGLEYKLQSNQFGFLTRQYHSTPYFAGLRKGATYSDNTVSYHIDPQRTLSGTVRISHNNTKPLSRLSFEYLNNVRKSSQKSYEINYRLLGTDLGNFSWSPYYFSQMLETNEDLNAISRSKSFRLKANYNTSWKNSLLTVNWDNGLSFENTSGRPKAPFYSTRFNIDYTYKTAGISLFYQHNPYYIADALAANRVNNNYNVLSIGPNISFKAAHSRLRVTSRMTYNYYGYQHSQNYIVSSYLRYRFKKDWALTGDVYFGLNKYQQLLQYDPQKGPEYIEPNIDYSDPTLFTSRRINIGIEKKIGSVYQKDVRKVSFLCFDDINNNGIRDKDEPYISDVMVKVNGYAAITNSKGLVTFQASRGQEYTPDISNTDGWILSSESPRTFFLDKNRTIELPLVKTARISGTLVVEESKYNKNRPNIYGVKVLATNRAGKTYKTITNEKGLFNLYVPKDTYKVTVDAGEFPLTIIDNSKVIDTGKEDYGKLTFITKDKSRNIEIQKF